MKQRLVFLMAFLALFLIGCGSEDVIGKSEIEVEDDGSITETVVEDFSQEYYDKDELDATIQSAIETYNQTVGEDHITLEKSDVSRDVARVTIKYQSSTDYIAFNQKTIYNGPLSGVVEAGYDAMTRLTDGDEELIPIHNLIVAEEDYTVAIFHETCSVKTSGRIMYTSENVTTEGSTSAEATVDGESPAFIVYR